MEPNRKSRDKPTHLWICLSHLIKVEPYSFPLYRVTIFILHALDFGSSALSRIMLSNILTWNLFRVPFFRLKNDKGGFHYSLIKRMFLRVMFGFQLSDPERKKEKKKCCFVSIPKT